MEQTQVTFFSKIKNWASSLLSAEWLSSLDIIKLTLCFGVAFLIGLIFKKSFKYIILYLLSMIIGLSVFHYFNILFIDVANIKTICGLDEINDWTEMTQFIAHQIKQHVVEVGISSVGLIGGFKAG